MRDQVERIAKMWWDGSYIFLELATVPKLELVSEHSYISKEISKTVTLLRKLDVLLKCFM